MRTLAWGVLIVFAVTACAGTYLMFALPAHHDAGCPFMPGEAALCSMSPLDHIGHWHTTFAATLAAVLVLLGTAVLLFYGWLRYIKKEVRGKTFYLKRVDYLPILFQKLFSQGILNPKAP
jgi:hypothetical protein